MNRDRKIFFDGVRRDLFGGRLAASQVAGMEVILDAAPATLPSEHLAYALATAKWETAHTMQPIAEYGRGAGRAYGRRDLTTGRTYYGRGYVQLTWKANYRKASEELAVDFVTDPDRAMEPALAARIMFRGMAEGWFTGKRLDQYFRAGLDDPVGARRIINGTDRAAEIAGLHRKFLAALRAAGAEMTAHSRPPARRPSIGARFLRLFS